MGFCKPGKCQFAHVHRFENRAAQSFFNRIYDLAREDGCTHDQACYHANFRLNRKLRLGR